MKDGKYVLMIVDDEILVGNSIRRMLQQNYDIKLFAQPNEALKSLDETIDLILSDYNMPEMNGIDFLREAAKKNPKAILMMMSARLEEIPEESMKELGLYAVVEKPFKITELKQKIEYAFQKNSSYSHRFLNQF